MFLEHGFEVYTLANPKVAKAKVETQESISAKPRKKNKKDAFQATGIFKKIKDSSPAEVRRQFLEHNMKA